MRIYSHEVSGAIPVQYDTYASGKIVTRTMWVRA